MQPKDVLDFWFVEHGPEDWFMGGEAFDAKCADRLSDIHEKAVRSELWSWRESGEGRLAEIILLDQLSRQLNRGSAKAFASDTMALALSQEAIAQGVDKSLDDHGKLFLYLPFQHAESVLIQQQSLKLHEALPEFQGFAKDHHDIIVCFGRFPLRNKALGRISTPEEIAYIEERGDKAY
jgi:uncharacterized protein (DUF924 family)